MNTDPTFLQQTGPSAYTLTLSASAAETFMLCPAKYSWSRVTGIEAAAARAGMNYGKAIHLALAHKYLARHGDAERMMGDAEAQMRDYFAEHPQPELGTKGRAEWRTLARAQQAFAAYNERYPAEDFEVLGVEEPFEVVLGEFETLVKTMHESGLEHTELAIITVKFRGIRDLRVRWHDAIWVLDHKTQQEWSDLVVDEGRASFQFQGYGWVERYLAPTDVCQCGETMSAHHVGGQEHSFSPMASVGGVIGNYLIAREPYSNPDRKPTTRDLPRDQFERQAYPYSDAQLDEWHGRAMGVARGIWQRWSESDWPQHSTACAHWGRCEYYRLCWETDPAYRMAAAMSADYRARTPSPFEETDSEKRA